MPLVINYAKVQMNQAGRNANGAKPSQKPVKKLERHALYTFILFSMYRASSARVEFHSKFVCVVQ